MTLNEYNRYCRSLTATTSVVQWGGAHVWKVGGKVFAIGGWNDDDQELFVTFKCSPMSYDMLREMPGCRPAPYLASRGMLWIQRTSDATLDDTGLKDYLRASYDLVIAGLTKRVRQEIGLVVSDPAGLTPGSVKQGVRPAGADPVKSDPVKSAAQFSAKTRTAQARAKARKGAAT